MILKIRTNKKPKFDYVLRYMIEDKNRLLDNGGKPFVITHNMKGKSIDGWAKQFREFEKWRMHKKRRDSIVLYHEIISFSPLDAKNLSAEKLETIIRQYIQLRNPNAGYVVCIHTDRDHIHAHICTSAIDGSGKNMRLSRKALADLKKNIQQYQIEKFPELSKSVVSHGRKSKVRVSEKEQQYKQRTGKMSRMEMLQSIVEGCYRKSKSPEDFYLRLKDQQLETYVRGGKVYGIISENRKYRFRRFNIDIEKFHEKEILRSRELNQTRSRKTKGNGRTI